MKTKVILLSVLMTASSLAMAQVKSKKAITKKNPKKAAAIKKKPSVSTSESTLPAPVQSYNKYTDGYWNYSLEESSSRENDYGSNTTYLVILSVNGEKVSSSIHYTEYYDNESGDTSVSLSANGKYNPTYVDHPKEWLKEELKYYIRKEYGGNHFNF